MISTSLRKYEVLKPLAYQLLLVKDSLGQANARLHQVIVLQDTAYADLGRTVYYRSVLLADQTAKTQQWKLKAKERWWVNAGLTLLLVGVTGLAITK